MNVAWSPRNLVAVVGVAALLATTALAADKPTDKLPADRPQVPEGWLLVEEDVWYQLADEPSLHFHHARIDFLRRAPQEAAQDVRKAAAMLKLAVANAQGEGKTDLQASIFELHALAEGLAHDKPVTAKLMDRVFARAHYALAQYNRDEALEHMDEGEFVKAGVHLRAAAHDIEHGEAWAGEEAPEASSVALQKAEKLAEELIAGGEIAADRFVQSLQALADEVARLKKLQELYK